MDSTLISQLVFRDYLAVFPDALDATRENKDTGVPKHVVPEAFIQGLVGGVVAALARAPVQDRGDGEDNAPGTAAAVRFTLPAATQAVSYFMQTAGWEGEAAVDAATVFIGSTLDCVQKYGRLQMRQNDLMGDGVSQVNPSTNPGLRELFREEVLRQMAVSFQATGRFCQDDTPGKPASTELVSLLGDYADAFAFAVASITATVTYTAPGGGAAVSDVVNTGAVV